MKKRIHDHIKKNSGLLDAKEIIDHFRMRGDIILNHIEILIDDDLVVRRLVDDCKYCYFVTGEAPP